jgi:hypothetical protein
VVKLNVDGVINSQENVAEVVVLRGWCRGFSEAHGKAYSGIIDLLIAAALSLHDAVVFAQDRNFRWIVIESDCSELARLWDTRRRNRPVITHLLEEFNMLS